MGAAHSIAAPTRAAAITLIFFITLSSLFGSDLTANRRRRFEGSTSKPDRPSPISSKTPQSGNILVRQVPAFARLKDPPLIAADASFQPLTVGVDLGERQAASRALAMVWYSVLTMQEGREANLRGTA